MAIFLDICKAFDCVDYEIFLTKLKHYGIKGKLNDLIRSYFANRKQKVSVNGTYSKILKDIELGVLQGSILGVLFFTIFINDIKNACPELLSILFADDHSAYLEAKNIEELLEKSNIELKALNDWYLSNKLAIHPLKSRSMIFYPPSRPPNLQGIDGNFYFPIYIDRNDPINFNPDLSERIKLVPNRDDNL